MNFDSKVQKSLTSFGSFIKAELEKSHIPGITTAIVFDQEIIFAEGFGFADLEAKTPAISQTIFRIGSITKLFTAIAIMQLRDSSLLQLDDKISTCISLPSEFHTITMRQLMTHTSGLPREAPLDYVLLQTEMENWSSHDSIKTEAKNNEKTAQKLHPGRESVHPEKTPG